MSACISNAGEYGEHAFDTSVGLCTRCSCDQTAYQTAEILRLVRAMSADIALVRDKVESVVPEVKPVLDQLTTSPLFRMIAGGKR